MRILIDAGILLAAYVFGSIPFGLLIVKALTGQDVRKVESGRTGGTNVMRAAGFSAGLLTAILDVFKAALTVWLAKWLTPDVWIHVLAPIAAVLGHNHSIFLVERGADGRLRMRGGAGGAAAFGGTLGLWPPSALIMLPVGFAVWYGLGFASVTTLSIGLMTMVIFAIRAAFGAAPWEYVVYGLLAEAMMAWALRPNIRRLIQGTERRHGLPVKIQAWRNARRNASTRRKMSRQAAGPVGAGKDR